MARPIVAGARAFIVLCYQGAAGSNESAAALNRVRDAIPVRWIGRNEGGCQLCQLRNGLMITGKSNHRPVVFRRHACAGATNENPVDLRVAICHEIRCVIIGCIDCCQSIRSQAHVTGNFIAAAGNVASGLENRHQFDVPARFVDLHDHDLLGGGDRLRGALPSDAGRDGLLGAVNHVRVVGLGEGSPGCADQDGCDQRLANDLFHCEQFLTFSWRENDELSGRSHGTRMRGKFQCIGDRISRVNQQGATVQIIGDIGTIPASALSHVAFPFA